MSTNHEVSNPVEEFAVYQTEQTRRLNALGSTLKSGLELISNLEACNQKFKEAERPDLVMSERAKIAQYTRLEDFPDKANNFTPSFKFILGGNEGKRAITKEELQSMREGTTADDIFGMKHMGAYVHTSPSFNRMLVLFPEFSDSFIMKFSQPDADQWDTFKPELFVAYQLMSGLVDVNDEEVINDGKVDEWYLCH
jgi:hypothetical protein